MDKNKIRMFKRKMTGQWVICHGKQEVYSSYSQADAQRKLTRIMSGVDSMMLD